MWLVGSSIKFKFAPVPYILHIWSDRNDLRLTDTMAENSGTPSLNRRGSMVSFERIPSNPACSAPFSSSGSRAVILVTPMMHVVLVVLWFQKCDGGSKKIHLEDQDADSQDKRPSILTWNIFKHNQVSMQKITPPTSVGLPWWKNSPPHGLGRWGTLAFGQLGQAARLDAGYGTVEAPEAEGVRGQYILG